MVPGCDRWRWRRRSLPASEPHARVGPARRPGVLPRGAARGARGAGGMGRRTRSLPVLQGPGLPTGPFAGRLHEVGGVVVQVPGVAGGRALLRAVARHARPPGPRRRSEREAEPNIGPGRSPLTQARQVDWLGPGGRRREGRRCLRAHHYLKWGRRAGSRAAPDAGRDAAHLVGVVDWVCVPQA